VLKRTRWIIGIATILVALVTVAGLAQNEGTHPVSGRPYASTMSAAGASWLDRPEREEEESPSTAIALLELKPGAVVADIGAGSGYYSLKIAEIVGSTGHVYAVDIQQDMLDIIKSKLGIVPVKNVTLVLAADDDPKLPVGALDMAIMVDVYHELHQPQAVLQHIRTALKPGGRLILLEYREEDPRVPIQRLHKMSVKTAKLEVEHEGFTLSRVINDLPWQHLLVFTKH
jgi:ubiquinone/menaquinone biosynthesis C-methylase UbiE